MGKEPKFPNFLKQLRLAKGWKQEEAAAAMGLSYGGYNKLEYGENQLTLVTIANAAKVYGVPKSYVLAGPETVPIVGFAGAGPNGEVVFEESAGELGEAPMPPGGTDRTVALEVRGRSMRGIAENGWLVYYDDRKDPITDDLVGELCVVSVPERGVLVKTPQRGRIPGHFDLESTNDETMRDVRIEWAALVTAIVPRRAARKLKKAG